MEYKISEKLFFFLCGMESSEIDSALLVERESVSLFLLHAREENRVILALLINQFATNNVSKVWSVDQSNICAILYAIDYSTKPYML